MPQLDINKLSDVCEAIIDCEHKTAPVVSEGYPSIRTPNIGKGCLLLDGVNRVSEEIYEKWTQRAKPKSGDLILAREAPVGNVAIIPNNLKVCLGQRTVLIRPDKTKIVGLYLLYLLLGDEIQARFHSQTAGATVAHLNVKDIKSLKLPQLPGQGTQRKIAAILSAYDDLIENNLRRIKILEEMAQNLYREWFVKFRFPGHEKIRMVDSPLGPIPEGWEVMSLGELVRTQYGYTESSQEMPIGPKYLRGMDINKTTYINWDVVPYCPISNEVFLKYKLTVGDIVIIRMADPGKVGIVEKNVGAVFASYLVRLSRISNRIGPYYMFYFLIDERYQGYITGASTGTTRKSASAGVLTGVDLVIPPESLLADFESKIQKFRCLLNNLIEKNNNLHRTRDLLLPKLISGEMDVSDLDIRVPELSVNHE
ncbi:MAG: restriction endonuclease subunit S [Candidatus Delongbacteria bacterium]